jgi:hypothetical protein
VEVESIVARDLAVDVDGKVVQRTYRVKAGWGRSHVARMAAVGVDKVDIRIPCRLMEFDRAAGVVDEPQTSRKLA